MKKHITLAMNELGFIGKDALVALGKSATNCKFINRCGLMQIKRLELSPIGIPLG